VVTDVLTNDTVRRLLEFHGGFRLSRLTGFRAWQLRWWWWGRGSVDL